jgi:hypothetical protein
MWGCSYHSTLVQARPWSFITAPAPAWLGKVAHHAFVLLCVVAKVWGMGTHASNEQHSWEVVRGAASSVESVEHQSTGRARRGTGRMTWECA